MDKDGKPTMLGIASGAIGGLAGITPASGYVNIYGALVIGIVAGILGFYGVTFLKVKLGYDDSLDVFGVHGIDGIWGSLAVGLFADPSVNGVKGIFYGSSKQFISQIIAVIAVIIFSAVGTLILAYLAKLIAGGWRTSEEEEAVGLDQSIHGEKSFELD